MPVSIGEVYSEVVLLKIGTLEVKSYFNKWFVMGRAIDTAALFFIVVARGRMKCY